MRVVTMTVIGGVAAFAAALAPSAAGSIKLRFDHRNNVIRIENGWSASADAPACRTGKFLKYDYSGNPYLKKVRVCA